MDIDEICKKPELRNDFDEIMKFLPELRKKYDCERLKELQNRIVEFRHVIKGLYQKLDALKRIPKTDKNQKELKGMNALKRGIKQTGQLIYERRYDQARYIQSLFREEDLKKETERVMTRVLPDIKRYIADNVIDRVDTRYEIFSSYNEFLNNESAMKELKLDHNFSFQLISHLTSLNFRFCDSLSRYPNVISCEYTACKRMSSSIVERTELKLFENVRFSFDERIAFVNELFGLDDNYYILK
jgi:hypothetical protein